MTGWITPVSGTSATATVRTRRSDDVDTTLSSTTPDVPRKRPMLPAPSTLGWGIGLGTALGALLLRSKGAGWGAGALASGAWKGALVGGGIGTALLGLDKLTSGQVKQQLDYVSLDRRAQILFVLRHPTNPWIAGTGLGVARDARGAQEQLYGTWDPLDGPQDAFRHSFAAALFSLRAMRDHGKTPEHAHTLAIGAGEAHEVDGQDNNDDFSRAMDSANNRTGTEIVGDGRAVPGENADANGFVTEHALRERVLAALRDGRLQVVDRSGESPVARASTASDLPRVSTTTGER